MGMFDFVRCKYPLTDRAKLNEKLRTIEFQTKSFDDPGLNYYEIRENGQLWYREGLEGEPTGPEILCYDFTGTINMGGGDFRGSPHGWYEFDVSFIAGGLFGITRILPAE
jgi:hypothetical protein